MNKQSLSILGLFLVASGLLLFAGKTPESPGGVACTLEAKICPDGSAVGRTGPHCEFAACPAVATSTVVVVPPGTKTETGIVGTVILGPTCPVLRDPPDPKCADKPYAAKLVAVATDGKVVSSFSADSAGAFKVLLPPGTYEIRGEASANILPRCASSQPIKVSLGAITQAPVFCDTGIR
ncbi:MAG: hypothetical protein V4674_02780 [Patescibacteria group bacterium]